MSCGRKTRGEGWGGGEYVGWREEGCHHFFWGVESFCIPRILSSSSETKSYGERARTETHAGDSEWQICTSEMFTWRGRGSLWAGEWRRTVFYLSRFKTVNQQILQNREKQDEITAVCSHLSCSETGAHVCPTLTLAARSTSLGMSSSSSTSISSSGMASSYSTCNKRWREAEHHQRPNIHQASL